MTRAVLSLGANLGDARGALAAAVRALHDHPDMTVEAVSGLWRTAPVGGPQQPDYLNAVVLVATELSPEELLIEAHELEAAAGRVRDERWGPRTLDVDLVEVAGVRRADPGLTLPHPRAHERAFVLAPWAQVAPTATLGGPDGPAVGELLASVADQAAELVAEGDWWR
jgi:2-amino-4-hydroxy-6-hydroxymethyldihydropteridine diphosphokinase